MRLDNQAVSRAGVGKCDPIQRISALNTKIISKTGSPIAEVMGQWAIVPKEAFIFVVGVSWGLGKGVGRNMVKEDGERCSAEVVWEQDSSA